MYYFVSLQVVYVPSGTPSSTSLDGYDRDMAALSREQQERLRMQSLPLQSDEVHSFVR